MEEQYQIFEKYISGGMEQEELASFEARLKNEPELAEELELFRNVSESMSAKFRHEENTVALKKTLHVAGEKHFQMTEEKPEAKVVSMGRRRLLTRLAATAAILLLLFVWSPWKKSLYEQYSTHAPLALAERSGSGSFDFSNAENAFNSGNYQVALDELKNYFKQNPNDLEVEFHLGICLLELNQFDDADVIFGKLNAGNSIFKTEGTWYLALSNLKQNKNEEARKYLTQIPEDSDRYQQAQELLSKI